MSEIKFQWSNIGHRYITNYLQRSIINGKVTHAYLFYGPKSVGKTTVAVDLATSLVCEKLHQPDQSVPCRQCDCCRQVAGHIHPDLVWLAREVDGKTDRIKRNISIEQVRELRNKLSLHPFLNSYKVAIIDEASYLSTEAANALLKTLEEPTPNTVIIILTDSLTAIPRTIISRCQVMKFLPVPEAEIAAHLVDLGVSKNSAKNLAAIAYGRPGLAVSYQTEPEILDDYHQQVKNFLSLNKSDINGKFKLIQTEVGYADSDEISQLLGIWTKLVRDLALIKSANKNLVGNHQVSAELEGLSRHYSHHQLIRILKEIGAAKRYLAANVNPRLVLENLILNF